MLSNVKQILFNNKYVENEAKDLIIDFTRNTYILKGSTGIGGTTALLNYTKASCLIISPNVGMIKGKEGKSYDSNKQFFIYSGSIDNWQTAKENLLYDSNIIINTTPEQIIKVRANDKELYELLITLPVFVDEVHSYSTDAIFRPALGEFMELVFNEWKACFKLSTATPNYNFIDIPKDLDIEYYLVKRANESQKELYYSNDLKDLKRFVYEENSKKRLVVIFSNNINIHKSFKDLKVNNLTGQSLRIKLAPFERGNQNENELITDTDLLILSSSYFAGFDIDKDCSIVIVSEQNNDAYKININNVVQAYGRCRKTVYKALFINAKAKYNINGKQIEVPHSIKDIDLAVNQFDIKVASLKNDILNEIKNDLITPSNYVNRGVLLSSLIEYVNDYHLYNDVALKGLFGVYGFDILDYNSSNEVTQLKNSIPFNTRLLALLEIDALTLKNSYSTIKYNLKIKDKGSYTAKLGLEYLTAYLLKLTDSNLIEKLNNKRVKPNEFYNSFYNFLMVNSNTFYMATFLTPQQMNNAKRLYFNDEVRNVLERVQYLVNDWHMLYAVHKITNNILPNSIEREILIYEHFYNVDLYKRFQSDKKNRIRNINKLIVSQLENNQIELRLDELKWLNDVSKNIFKSLDNNNEYSHSNSRKNIKTKMINAIIYLMTKGKCFAEVKDVKDRIYSPITQLPKALRCIIPIKYVSVDLTSANPQIVDKILGTNLAMEVYQNLMKTRGINRSEAKVLYNSSLNNHYQSVNDALAIYLDAGYSESDALRLAKMTARVEKGSFYELMTASERVLMENYQKVIPIDSYRFHDAIIMSYEDIKTKNIELVKYLDSYEYHFEFFNDSSSYNDKVSNEMYFSVNGFLDNKIILKKGA